RTVPARICVARSRRWRLPVPRSCCAARSTPAPTRRCWTNWPCSCRTRPPDPMSQALTLARPYARAAFMLAHDAGALAAWSQALGFAARVAVDPQASALLGHPALSRAQAVGLLAPEGATPV